uniref:EGF-like domain-containing protein n=1 Tax=Pundamilia nyererei TaxID=303518 RepID=A0A3B4H350_9CICH
MHKRELSKHDVYDLCVSVCGFVYIDIDECKLQNAVCEFPCANGGRCVGPDTCQCPSDYTGPQCVGTTEIYPSTCLQAVSGKIWTFFCTDSLCTPACQNGGRCVDVNKCTCVGGWQGARCQIGEIKLSPSIITCGGVCQCIPVVCQKPCINGGVCVGLNRCRCTKGFTGELCEQG